MSLTLIRSINARLRAEGYGDVPYSLDADESGALKIAFHAVTPRNENMLAIFEDMCAPDHRSKTELKAHAADVRYRKEVGGITIGARNVPTDRDAQSRIAVLPAKAIKFKGPDGFASLTAAQVKAMQDAVEVHTQACFALEAQVSSAIDAGTITTKEQVDAAFA